MKKIFLVVIMLLLSVTSVLFGCYDKTDEVITPPPAPTVKVGLDNYSKSIVRFESFMLKAKVENSAETVQWTTSAPQVATVSTSGEVMGLTVGNAIISAKVGSVSANCNITVTDTGALPTLEIDKTSIQTVAGQQFAVTASLKLGKFSVTTAIFKWEVNNENKVAILSGVDNGTVMLNALEKGEATVKVKVTFDSIEYEKTLTVNVIETYTLDIDNLQPQDNKYKKSMTVSKLGDYETLDTEFTPNISAYLNDKKVDNAKITHEVLSGQGGAVSISSAMAVQAISAGTVTIRFSSVSAMGTTSFIDMEITVFKPYLTLSDVIEVDLKENSTRITNAQIPLPNVVQGSVMTLKLDSNETDFTVEANKVSFAVSAEFKAGNRQVFISTDKADYEFKLLAVSMYIKTVEDFKQLSRVIDATKIGTNEGDYTWNGYYVISENIDLSKEVGGYYVWSGVANDGYIWEETNENRGFIGEIDGRGKYIRGLKMSNGAFIGRLGKSGIIKNLAFIDAIIDTQNVCGFVTDCIRGTIENVMVVGSNCGGSKVSGDKIKASAMLTSDLLSKAVLKNCVVYITDMPNKDNGAIANSIWFADWDKTSNIYAIGTTKMLFVDDAVPTESKGSVKGFNTALEFDNYTNTTFGESFASYWDNNIWDTTSYNWPVFDTFKVFADSIQSSQLNTDNVNIALPTQLTCSLNTLVDSYSLSSPTEGITISKKGLVTCSELVTTGVSFNVKVTTVWGKEIIFPLTTVVNYSLSMNAPTKKIMWLGDKFTPNVTTIPSTGAIITLEVKTPSATVFAVIPNNSEYIFTQEGDYIFKATATIEHGSVTSLTDSFSIHVLPQNVINDFYGDEALNSVTHNKECTLKIVDGKLKMTSTSAWPAVFIKSEKFTDFTQFKSLSFEVSASKPINMIVAIIINTNTTPECPYFSVGTDTMTVTKNFSDVANWTNDVLKNAIGIKLIGYDSSGVVFTFDNIRFGQ